MEEHPSWSGRSEPAPDVRSHFTPVPEYEDRPHEPPVTSELTDAVEFWQSGEASSSLLRAAARVHLGVAHYFGAAFIDNLESAAAANRTAMQRGLALLRALWQAASLPGEQWHLRSGREAAGFIGRGIKPKGAPFDNAIVAACAEGALLEMPLWGMSLDPEQAAGYGAFIRFEIVGPLRALVAKRYSTDRSHDVEAELITGGTYRVVSVTDEGDTKVVRLRSGHEFDLEERGPEAEYFELKSGVVARNVADGASETYDPENEIWRRSEGSLDGTALAYDEARLSLGVAGIEARREQA